MPSVTVAPRSREFFASVSTLNGSREVSGFRVSGKRNIGPSPCLVSDVRQRHLVADASTNAFKQRYLAQKIDDPMPQTCAGHDGRDFIENATFRHPQWWLFGVARDIVEDVAVFHPVEDASYSVFVQP
jgi:hypothetical protein